MDYFNAFWVGGVICALVQILLDKTKLMPGRVMVILVCSGALLSAIGIYHSLCDWSFCCADFFLSRQPDLQTQNERLTCGLSEGDFYE